MADGTLRIAFDVEPMHAQDAFRLFAAPGTPAALAALKVGYAAANTSPKPVNKSAENEQIEKPKIGPLAYWLVLRCNELGFSEWLRSIGYVIEHTGQSGDAVKDMLGVESRKDVDGDMVATERFHRLIRGPYSRWCAARGVMQ